MPTWFWIIFGAIFLIALAATIHLEAHRHRKNRMRDRYKQGGLVDSSEVTSDRSVQMSASLSAAYGVRDVPWRINPADALVELGADPDDPKIVEMRRFCDEPVDLYRAIARGVRNEVEERYEPPEIRTLRDDILPHYHETAKLAEAMMPEQMLHRSLTQGEIESGEYLPVAMLRTPNIGGEGNPDYAGPHYDSTHGSQPRFAPYDMLREPMPGQAVIRGSDVAAFGPIPEDDDK